jgi:hypothetical protein
MCHDQPCGRLLTAFVVVLCGTAALARAQELPQRHVDRDLAAELACAPRSPLIAPDVGIRIAPGSERLKALYAPGDEVLINAGTANGIEVGQRYFVRRIVSDRFTEETLRGFDPVSVHTAGWVEIVGVQERTSTARVVRACDGVLVGDYLETFRPPVVPGSDAEGHPDFAHPARVILGDDRRQLGAAGSMMVLDRGTDGGLRPGQRLTLFRVSRTGPAWPIGTGTVLEIDRSTSVFRIDRSSDAVYVGDLAAIQK